MPFIATFLTPIIGATAAGIVSSIITAIIVNVALGAIARLMAPKPPTSGPPPVNVTVRGAVENRRLVFGRRRCAGVMAFYGVSGANNKYLWYVVVMSGHQVSAVRDVWIDAELVPNANINPTTGLVSGTKVFEFNGTLANGSNVISNCVVPGSLQVGGTLTDAEGKIPAATTVVSIGDNTVTMSHAATGTVSAPETITYTIPGADSKWNGKLYIWRYAGTSAQTADSAMMAAFGAWNSDHKLQGCAYVVVRMERDDTVYQSGPPQNICALVDGALLYDPRKDSANGGSGSHRTNDPSTWEFSQNPALAVRWYLTGGTVHNDQTTRLIKYGLRDTDSRVDDPYTIACANICDELIEGSYAPPTGQQVRYQCNLEVTTGESRRDIMTAMLASMAGSLVYVHGKWRIYAGAYDSPTHTLTQDDLYGDLEVQDTSTHADRHNQVAATFVDAYNQWTSTTTIWRTDSAYETQDGGEAIQQEIDLRGVTDRYQAQRLAEIQLRKSRMMRTVTLHGALNLLAVAQNETLTFSHARYGWSNRVFRCTQRQFDFGKEAGQVLLTCQQEDPAVYNDMVTEDYETGTSATDTFESDSPDTPMTLDYTATANLINFVVGLPSYLAPGAVIELWEYTAVTPFSSATLLLESRSNTFSIAKADTTVRYYWIRVRNVDGSVSGTVPATNGLAAAAEAAGAEGPPGADALTLVLSSPFAAVMAYADGTVMSTANANGTAKVYAGTTDVTSSCTFSATAVNCTGSINTANGTPVGGQPIGYYQITALSADAGALNISAVYSGQTLTATYSILRVKIGIEIVTSLPSTNLFQGRTVYLTSDDKLYRYDGGSWTTAVPATDVTGQIVAAQLADHSVTVTKLLITDTSNICGNGDFQNDTVGSGPLGWSTWTTTISVVAAASAPSGCPKAKAIVLTGRDNNYAPVGNGFPVAPGQSYFLSMYCCNGDSSYAFSIGLYFMDSSGAALTWMGAASAPSSTTTWTRIGGNITVPANAQFAQVWVQIAAFSSFGHWYATGIECRRAANGELIVDGSVVASKIAANTITASQIAASTITGDRMVAGTVTAAQMAASTITAASGILADACITNAKIGNLEVDSAKIANLTVTTGKVALNAITGYGASVRTTYASIGAGGTLVSFNLTTQGGPILLLASADAGANTSSSVSIEMRCSATGDTGYDIQDWNNTSSFLTLAAPYHGSYLLTGLGAGTYTFDLYAWGSGACSYAHLVALEFKR